MYRMSRVSSALLTEQSLLSQAVIIEAHSHPPFARPSWLKRRLWHGGSLGTGMPCVLCSGPRCKAVAYPVHPLKLITQAHRRSILLWGVCVPGLLAAAAMSASASLPPSSLRTVRLNTGDKVPSVGLGVFLSKQGRETYQAVREALNAGYRHIDTAQLYRNEADVGQQRPIFTSAPHLTTKLT